MKCQNCGHENDTDAKFCEKCGLNLNKSSMPNSTKILIVVEIVLVAGLGLVSGMMLMNNQAKLINNNTTVANNTPVVNNTTSPSNNVNTPKKTQSFNNNNTQSTKQTQQITASQAEDIAAQDTGQTPIDVEYVPAYNYYHVDLQVTGQKYTDYVFVDATTGNIVNWVNGEPTQQ